MESEGPYRHSTYGHATGDLTKCLACAHAEGRKSMEKDFKEALGWADSICLDWNYSKDYKKWKKARGIE